MRRFVVLGYLILAVLLSTVLGAGCAAGLRTQTGLPLQISPPKISLDLAEQIALGNLNRGATHWFEASSGLYGPVMWEDAMVAAYQITIVNHNPEADSLLLSYVDANTGEILFDQQQVFQPQFNRGCDPAWYRCLNPAAVIALGPPQVSDTFELGWLNPRVGSNVTPTLLTDIWPKLAAGEPVPVYRWDSWRHQVQANWIVGHDGTGYIVQSVGLAQR